MAGTDHPSDVPAPTLHLVWYMSTPHPHGHLVLIGLPAAARLWASYIDEADPRDITRFAPDLVLLGLEHGRPTTPPAAEAPTDSPPGPSGAVRVADLELDLAGGPEPVFVYAHPTGRQVAQFDHLELLELASWGVTHQVTAGIAATITE